MILKFNWSVSSASARNGVFLPVPVVKFFNKAIQIVSLDNLKSGGKKNMQNDIKLWLMLKVEFHISELDNIKKF